MIKKIIGILLLSSITTNSTKYFDPCVYTPLGSSVSIKYKDELSLEEINQYNTVGDLMFDDDVRLAPSSRLYNCHSYAWYCQYSNLNNVWIDNPSPYYEAGDGQIASYFEINDISLVLPRDRICYYDQSNNNIHSGIVVSTSGMLNSNGICGTANMFIVQSKWDYHGLYEHRGDKCPYTLAYSECTNPAIYVKYYRYIVVNHQHNYAYQTYNSIKHIETCNCSTGRADYSPCGALYLSHNFVLYYDFGFINYPNYLPKYICSDCGYIKNGPLNYL